MESKIRAMRCAILCLLALPSIATAQTTLRWHLSTGDKLTVEVSQKTASEIAYSGKKTPTQIDLSMQLAWEVASADDSKIHLKQSLKRVTIHMESSTAGRVDYDSADTTRPTGRARELATAVAPLLTTTLEVTMNNRGEILDAKPFGQPPAQPAADPAKPSIFDKATIQQLLRQPLAVLPEKPVQPNDEWHSQIELNTSLGKATQSTTYRYTGPVEEDGQKLEKIDVKTVLKLAQAADQTKLTLKEHSQTGTILFSVAAGRVMRAEQNQKLLTERPYRETTIVVSLTSNQTTKVSATKE